MRNLTRLIPEDLPPGEDEYWKALYEMIEMIETSMRVDVDTKNLDEMAFALQKALTHLSMSSKIIELSNFLYDKAKGRVIQSYLDSHEDYKQDVLKKWLDGQLASYSSMFVRAERVCKDLANYIDGMRTLISTEKEQLKNIQQ